MKYKHVIWDWNGTVVDDVALSVDVLNEILKFKNLPAISVENYKETFSFPVTHFYESLGIKFEPEEAERVGERFIAHYNARRFDYPVHGGVVDLMKNIESRGVPQSILSAYQKNYLDEAAAHYGVDKFMTHVAGLDNIHAETKIELGKKLVAELALEPSSILIIGDTDHDFAVAQATGVDAFLFSGGHQSAERLRKTGAEVFGDYKKLSDALFNNG